MGLLFPWRAYTPRIQEGNPGESVSSLETMRLGGVDQAVLIRGRKRSGSIILFLHGGPGMPMMFLAHRFQRPLEDHFLVVQWDRRGSGKSFTKQTSPESISVKQEVADTIELSEILCSRYDQDKIILAGHSYGTYLGMLVAHQCPRLYHAYVGIGQLAHSEEKNRAIQRDWIRESAKATNDNRTLVSLESGRAVDLETWLWKFGGEMHRNKSWTTLLRIGLRAPEYSLTDAFRVKSGVQFTHKHMKYNAINGDLIDEVRELSIPVYFFTGRYDYTAPFQYTLEYADRIRAPYKEVVWFEKSAHFPFLEEPLRFAEEMRKVAARIFSEPHEV